MGHSARDLGWLGVRDYRLVIPMRLFLGWGTVSAMALAISGGDGVRSEVLDPADLTGEQLRPSVVGRDMPANEGATTLWQSLVKLRSTLGFMLVGAHAYD